MAGKGTTLDMSLFYGTTEQKQAFCRDLLHVLRTRGGVKLQNHPIPDKDIYELFSWVSFDNLNRPSSQFLTRTTDQEVL